MHNRQVAGDGPGEAPQQKVWAEEAEETYVKHRQFLKRDAAEGSSTSWRPRKVHRASSAKVLKMLDNQTMCLDAQAVSLLWLSGVERQWL